MSGVDQLLPMDICQHISFATDLHKSIQLSAGFIGGHARRDIKKLQLLEFREGESQP